MKKFAVPLLFLIALAMTALVWAEHAPGHLDFPDMPFLSETAVDNDANGTLPIIVMVDVGIDDVVLVPAFKIRILMVWANIEVTDSEAYTITDGTLGNDITNSFSVSRKGYRAMEQLDVSLAEIDPAAGESVTISIQPTATTAEGHIFFMVVRVL